MKWDDYFKTLLALVIWREARGEGQDGMRAVAHVIRNRVVATHLPDRWEDVILGKNQFTSMTYAGDSQLVAWPKEPDEKFEFAMRTAQRVYDGEDEDNTGGALFYANLKSATSGWFFTEIVGKPLDHPRTVTIGRHTFFK